MRKKIQVVIKEINTTTIDYIERKTSISDLVKRIQIPPKKIIAAYLNNNLVDLSANINHNSEIFLIRTDSSQGLSIYRDTAAHILALAVKKIFGRDILNIGPSIRYNYYFDLDIKVKINKRLLSQIENVMRSIIVKDLPIEKKIVPAKTGISFYRSKKEFDKADLIATSEMEYVKFYSIQNFQELCPGPVAPSTGFITQFKLISYPPGFLLLFPKLIKGKLLIKPDKTPKQLSKVFLETRNWYQDLGVSSVSHLNKVIMNKELGELITISEALHSKRIAQIADTITKKRNEVKLVLIAGPSASGKTTFLKRLYINLRVNGIKPVSISLDNYFLDRKYTPRDKDGHYNFECLEALDLELLNKHLCELMKGKTIFRPKFDFKQGSRKKEKVPLKLIKDQILIIEGIHGLNEKLTRGIPRKNKFKIYVSALSTLRLSDSHRITTTDTRLLRRIIRDAQYRGYSAVSTLKNWPKVHDGEERYIFPFQEMADIMFNSALVYEISVIKSMAQKLLLKVSYKEKEYSEARRLLDLLEFFRSAPGRDVPKTSILREFLGGSSFNY
ncbi:MAG: nucleoside kinase [Spirochaetes bacterium]|nr:nucleoside kinase [Spirochaetota bacterium]